MEKEEVIPVRFLLLYTDSICFVNQSPLEAVTILDDNIKLYNKEEVKRILEAELDYLEKTDLDSLKLKKFEDLIPLYKELRGELHPTVAVLYQNQASLAYNLNDYNAAINYINEALKIYQNSHIHILGRDDNLPYEEECHFSLSKYYSMICDNNMALSENMRAEEIYRGCEKDAVHSIYEILTQRGSIYRDMGKYNEMMDCYNQVYDALKLQIEIDNDNGKTLRIFDFISDVLMHLNMYHEADKYILLGLQLLETENYSNPCYFDFLKKAVLNGYKIDDDKTEIIFPLIKKVYSQEELKLSEYFHFLASLVNYYGKHHDFDKMLFYLKEIDNLNLLEEDDDFDTCITLWAKYYYYQGEITKALSVVLDELKRREKKYGNESIKYANCLNNVAAFYQDLNSLEKALGYAEKCYEIRNKILDDSEPLLHHSLNNLSSLYFANGEYHKALELLERYFIISNNPENGCIEQSGIILQNIGITYRALKDYENSFKYLTDGLNLIKNFYSINSLEYHKALSNLTSYYLENNKLDDNVRFEEAYRNEKESMEILKNIVGEKNPYYISKLGDIIYLSFVFEDYDVFESAYHDYDLFLKNTTQSNLNGLEKDEQENYWDLQKSWFFNDLIFYASEMPEMDSVREAAYNGLLYGKTLLLDIRNNKTENGNKDIEWHDVQSSLPSQSIAIEFGRYNYNDTIKYVAFVIDSKCENPLLINLCSEHELKQIDPEEYYSTSKLTELIWNPLNSIMEGNKNIYFSPIGLLQTIAIEYVPANFGDGYLSDSYNFHRLTSTKELCNNKDLNNLDIALLFGNIDYSSVWDLAKREEELITDNFSLSITRSSLCSLPGTKIEIDSIKIEIESRNKTAIVRTQAEASEKEFKELTRKVTPNIIHIATHGFYWDDGDDTNESQLKLITTYQINSSSREELALCRSGLILAGGNKALKREFDNVVSGEDGILTAKEISEQDLSHVDLAVLSACQTGLGSISDDGVFGLQRGFKIAGVKSILMSLWEVDDEATQILMTNFYKNYLGGMSKQQALREAQKSVRETPGFSDPQFWAAFILLDALN